ncbi:MAG: TIGR00282 family metallophosphoesterase [Clostridia bacterium]|nr:TIGR00282 family metallophosphoesterase [Clostridia bacterium]
MMKILVLGDISRSLSCKYVSERLWKYRKDNGIDLVIVNGENSAEQNGIDRASADMLFSAGADVITTGNHAFKRYEAKTLFEEEKMLLRPANFPGMVPGEGTVLVNAAGMTVLVLNLLGVVMMEPLENPFFTIEKILTKYKGEYDIAVLDFHAEATSEKQALAHYLDGRITLFFGTHTHVATADECILPKGTAYITDIGMCGPDFSVLGIKPECIIEKMTTGLPVKFIPSTNKVTAHGIIVEVDKKTKKATSIKRITF